MLTLALVARKLVSIVALVALVGAGCARPAWPGPAASVADPGFAARALEVATVDVLPIDLAVWTEAGVKASPEELHARAAGGVMSTAVDTLSRRAYGIQTMIDERGAAGSTPVLPGGELPATLQALAGYGEAVEAQPVGLAGRALPELALPVPLGRATGADATLYVGGWAYVARPRTSTGTRVAQGIAIGIVAIALIGVILAIASSTEKGKGKDSSSSSSSSPRTGGSSMRDHRDALEGVRDHRAGGGASLRLRDHRAGREGGVVRDHREGGLVRDHRGDRSGGARSTLDLALDLGTDGLDDEPVSVEPDPGAEPRPDRRPRTTPRRSTLYLEMTLVENRTGRVLWHAHQTSPANASRRGEVERAARLLLATLPAR